MAAVGAWFSAQGIPTPQRDPRLDDAAAIASSRAGEGATGEADLRFALRRAGVVDSEVISVRSAGSARRILAELDRRGPQAAAMTHWGAAGDDATVILARRMVRLDSPPPLRVRGDSLLLTGGLTEGWSELHVLFSRPDGQVVDAPIRRKPAGGFDTRIPLTAGPGRYRVELLVEGPTVAALFSVWSGTEAPLVPEVRLPPRFRSPAANLEETRRRAGAPPLRRLDALDAVALAHSADMARRGYFAHRSPDGAGPLERVARSGVTAGRVLENIATASDPARAHMQVVDSPGHLRNMVDPAVTDYGLGVFWDAGVAYVTWVFAELRTSSGAGTARRSGRAQPRP